jgi:hypothetical protein
MVSPETKSHDKRYFPRRQKGVERVQALTLDNERLRAELVRQGIVTVCPRPWMVTAVSSDSSSRRDVLVC